NPRAPFFEARVVTHPLFHRSLSCSLQDALPCLSSEIEPSPHYKS
ncbi:hypothetical protein TNIN_447441, partial [Trichonephila inaurata madagascariensis]